MRSIGAVTARYAPGPRRRSVDAFVALDGEGQCQISDAGQLVAESLVRERPVREGEEIAVPVRPAQPEQVRFARTSGSPPEKR
jgi:hypothetical protein